MPLTSKAFFTWTHKCVHRKRLVCDQLCALYCTGHVTSHVSCTVMIMWPVVCLVLYWSCDQSCVLYCIGHVTSRVFCTVLVMWLVTCLAQYWSCDKWYVSHRTGHLTRHSLSTASKQMKERILQLVLDSFKDQFYSKALDCVRVLREEAMKVGTACLSSPKYPSPSSRIIG